MSRFAPWLMCLAMVIPIQAAAPMPPIRRFQRWLPPEIGNGFTVCCPWFAFAAYPLSGGFQPWSLISERLAPRLLRLEHALEPTLGRFMGFRMMLVVEKAVD